MCVTRRRQGHLVGKHQCLWEIANLLIVVEYVAMLERIEEKRDIGQRTVASRCAAIMGEDPFEQVEQEKCKRNGFGFDQERTVR